MENLVKNNKPHHLRQTAPWLFLVCFAYGITNMMIGIGLYNTSPRAAAGVLINHVLTTHFWGYVFFALGVFGLISLWSNKREFIRAIMVCGLIVKSLWFYALLIKATWATLAILGVWGLLFAIQLITVVYYPDK